MKRIGNFKLLRRDELVKINGSTSFSAGDCENYINLTHGAMPEPGRYCLSKPE